MILLSLLLLNCGSLKNNCDFIKVRAFTHYNFGIGLINSDDKAYFLDIYDAPNGKIVRRIPPDEEAGHIVYISGVKDNFFEVDFEELNIKNVWIKKGMLGLITRNYDGRKLNLYKSPKLDSKVSSVLENEHIVKVMNVCNDWAYVETINDGKTKKGWLQPDMQCGNPYTTCP